MLRVSIRTSRLARAIGCLFLFAAWAALACVWADAMQMWLVAPLFLLLLQFSACLRGLSRSERVLSIGSEFCVLEHGGDRVKTSLPQLGYLSEWLIVFALPPMPQQDMPAARSTRRLAGKQIIMILPGMCSEEDEWRLRRYLCSRLDGEQDV